jgi:putative PIN family toxin of toxin-antitoxin system
MRVVLDTNVVVSAHLKAGGLEDQTLRLVFQRVVTACASESIFEEYFRVLGSPRLGLNPAKVRTSLDHLRKQAVFVNPIATLNVCSHEPDNRFLECAEAAKADVLVTGNKKHFPAAWKTTKVMNARQFLELIADEVPR